LGDKAPLTFGDLAFPIGMILLLNILFLSFTLTTRIESDSLSYRFFPFTRWRTFRFEEIEAMELREYNGLWEYGGWGIKWNGDSWSYTTGGKWGILVKTQGKKFLLERKNPRKRSRLLLNSLPSNPLLQKVKRSNLLQGLHPVKKSTDEFRNKP
jgi:hypothetical protein